MASMTVKRADLPSGVAVVLDEDADETITESRDIMKGPCRLYSLDYVHGDANVGYVKLWDNVNPTVGTTDPDFVFMVLASGSGTIPFPVPIIFTNGISWAFIKKVSNVDGPGTSGTTGPTATSTIAATLKEGAS